MTYFKLTLIFAVMGASLVGFGPHQRAGVFAVWYPLSIVACMILAMTFLAIHLLYRPESHTPEQWRKMSLRERHEARNARRGKTSWQA